MNEKLIELRVQGIKEAAARARLAFFITIFACGTILITIYNNYFPWNRIVTTPNQGLTEWPQPNLGADEVHDPAPPQGLNDDRLKEWAARLENEKTARTNTAKELSREGHKESVKNLQDDQAIAISLLGIRLSSADLDIFGSIGVFITSMYYLLSVRRLSLEVESLLTEAEDPVVDLQARWFVYEGVRQSYVLNTEAQEALISPDAMQGSAGDIPSRARTSLTTGRKVLTAGEATPGIGLSRWLFPKLTYLPVFTIAIMLLSDWYYVQVQVGNDYGSWWWWWTHLAGTFKLQFVIMEAVAVLVGLGILRLNLGTSRLQHGAVARMNAFLKSLVSPESRMSAAGSG